MYNRIRYRNRKKTMVITLLAFLAFTSTLSEVLATTYWTSRKLPASVTDIDNKIDNESRLTADDGSSAEIGAIHNYGYALLMQFSFGIDDQYIYSIQFRLDAKRTNWFGAWSKYKAIIKDTYNNFIAESSYSSYFTTAYAEYDVTVPINTDYDPDTELKLFIWVAKGMIGSTYMDYVSVRINYGDPPSP